MALHPVLEAVTARIIARSAGPRAAYLDLIDRESEAGLRRGSLSCGNLAHGFAAALDDKATIRSGAAPNIGIVTAYNDMLSAHQPYGRYPEALKIFAREAGGTAQVAGGVPAMCDGVTQGQAGMELSLLSRDVIAMSTAVALSHAMFEGTVLLGICDKIVPGLLIAALRFGHLPALFIPSGPMRSGLPNKEKAAVRQRHAAGEASREELLDAESQSYHSPGTCTFYGTANSNQMFLEMMGLQLPGSSFVNPGTPIRTAITRAAMHLAVANTRDPAKAFGRLVDARSIVNAITGLLATGGSTNHAIHLPAIARAAGLIIDWQDFDDLSWVTPLIAHVYPGGSADVNAFHAAGGMAFVISELVGAGLAHGDIATIAGPFSDWTKVPVMDGETLGWTEGPKATQDASVLAPVATPFAAEGGMRLLAGNLGRAIIKTSAIPDDRHSITAPVRIFHDQDSVIAAFKAGELDRDVIVAVRFQGPRANGMPELHKLTPTLGLLQDRGHRVALITDGRMSGASGKVPAAIHLIPEAHAAGPLSRLRDGDMVTVCADTGVISADADLASRPPAPPPPAPDGLGRELFRLMRHASTDAEAGACSLLV
ncbi:phosphogluconate dehydratase [Polymorphobacter multimanifer]|uniref:Phosphogluconate dehydratase n=2 Tax=Polymorphobacter multimanifer TaxID=1070431 RepID=A0A841L6C0_9SPHN|nr:phosphogluconate dehydratase [Polymorphobacter multimanifer]GGI80880.1 phosphogluconate dehydratase [Polymorphobacter multimanifer]